MKSLIGLVCAAAAIAGLAAVPVNANDEPVRVEVAAQSAGLQPARRLSPPPAIQAPAPPAATAAEQVLAIVNAERAARGLRPLALDYRLQVAAQAHSADQAAHNKMSHTGSDGSDLRTRMNRSGFPWRSAGENVAYGYGSAAHVMLGWMNSTGHRNNILGSYTHLGVGLAYSANGVPYWTQVFARA